MGTFSWGGWSSKGEVSEAENVPSSKHQNIKITLVCKSIFTTIFFADPRFVTTRNGPWQKTNRHLTCFFDNTYFFLEKVLLTIEGQVKVFVVREFPQKNPRNFLTNMEIFLKRIQVPSDFVFLVQFNLQISFK